MGVQEIDQEVSRRLQVAARQHPETWAVARRLVGRIRQAPNGETTITTEELRQLLRSAENEASLLALLGRRRVGRRPR